MSEQPEALRLADAMLNYWDERGPDAEAVAAELRRLHEVVERKSDAIQKLWKQRDTLEAANKEFEKRQEWWNNRMVELEAALRQAAEALETVVVDAKTTPNAYEANRQAITAAKQALGEQT